jgi:hypothetical protein
MITFRVLYLVWGSGGEVQYVNINVRHQDDDLHFVFHLTMRTAANYIRGRRWQ